MIKREFQRAIWVLLVLNVLILGVVVVDWRADQVRQMSGSVQGLASDSVREIMVAPASQSLDAVAPAVLIEPQPSIDASSAAAPQPLAGADVVPSLNVECVLIGPFSAGERAKVVALNTNITASSWVTETLALPQRVADAVSGHRVYVGPAESLNAAYQLRKALRDQGLDSFVMTDGPLAKSVSLGVFSSYGAAKRFVAAAPVAEQAKLAIHSPNQPVVVSYLRLVGENTEWVDALQAEGLMTPAIGRKVCPASMVDS